jgi:putative acyl-CoA dehydrogenase
MDNNAPVREDHDAFALNTPLVEAVAREGAAWATDRCHAVGALVGSREARFHAARSEAHPPVLHRYDRFGDRIDQIERDPSWHWLVDRSLEHDLHGLPWRSEIPAHAARAAMVLSWGEMSLPSICPSSGNYSMVPALRASPEISAAWTPRLISQNKPDLVFAAASLTERQGGSDVRSNRTTAQPVGGDLFVLNGLKWFITCPWADLLLVLAQAPGGLTCFVVESAEPGFRIERLKDKMGWKALGVGEIELRDVPARQLGVEGRGVGVIMRMIAYTRLDVMLECASSLRKGTIEAIHQARHRHVLGKTLVKHSSMRNVLADLALESEAATVAAMRVARSYDEPETKFGRLALSVLKYWISKRAAGHAAEALECLGGNGYVEESGMPTHFRDAALGSVWEGSGNVAALDVLRALRTDPQSLDEFIAECELAKGGSPALDAWIGTMRDEAQAVAGGDDAEWGARRLVERLALGLQASLLTRFSPSAVSDAFCASRLPATSLAYGGLPPGVDVDAILSRALPA